MPIMCDVSFLSLSSRHKLVLIISIIWSSMLCVIVLPQYIVSLRLNCILVTCYAACCTMKYRACVVDWHSLSSANWWLLGFAGIFQFVRIWWREPRTSSWRLRDPSGSLLRFSTSPPASPLVVKVLSLSNHLLLNWYVAWLWLFFLIEFYRVLKLFL